MNRIRDIILSYLFVFFMNMAISIFIIFLITGLRIQKEKSIVFNKIRFPIVTPCISILIIVS